MRIFAGSTDEEGAGHVIAIQGADVGRQRHVLLHAPNGRAGPLTGQLLERASIAYVLCSTLRDLVQALAIGAGAILINEEALDEPGLDDLTHAIDSQPPWSDIPVLLFAGSAHQHVRLRTLQRVRRLGNVTLIDRPMRLAAVLSAIESALRSRARQYELCEVLIALREAREQADAINRVRDEFLATLSHELRTPLNAMLGWASMLRSGQVHGALVARAHEIIERNARAQQALVADMLDVSRIITGKLALSPGPARVGPLLMSAIETLGAAADAKRVCVRTHIEPADAMVLGDVSRLRQVFWNLLSNAVKFTPPEGCIDVELRLRGDQVIVTVRDTGIGIDHDFLPTVFDRFRQADATPTRRYGGLGLGLAIVRHIVDLHGGRVEAHSPGPGLGSTFIVTLPRLREARTWEAPPPADAEAEADTAADTHTDADAEANDET
jgi:signal transduction histidine kinase